MTAAKDGVQGRRRLRIFAAAVALVLLCAVCVGGVSGAGLWTELADTDWYYNNPDATEYTITTAKELAGLSKLVHNSGSTVTDFDGKTIYLGADIDLAGYSWVSIGYIRGSGMFQNNPFKGTFDGKGHTISNIVQETIGSNEPGGLFGNVNGGTITNVKLQNVEINVHSSPVFVGSLVGVLKDGTVTDCKISGYNIIKPHDDVATNGFSNSGVVTVDDVIGEIRGTNEFIYGITSTDIDISGEFSNLDVTVNYKDGANHQNRGLVYEVTIPPQLVISDETGTGTMYISVSRLRIPSSTEVGVYVYGDFRLEHQTAADSGLNYVLMDGAGSILSNGKKVGRFTLSDFNPFSLTAKVIDQASYSGSYSDTLTFTYGLEETA